MNSRAILEAVNYASDSRTQGPAQRPVLYTVDAQGCDVEIPLPCKWAVCPVCEGEGSHVNPSIDAGGLTAEDFQDDPDFADGYLRGDYDETCNRCEGRRVVQTVDWQKLTPEQTKAYRRQLNEEAAHRAACLAEIRRGA